MFILLVVYISVTSGTYRPLCRPGPDTRLLHKELLAYVAGRPLLETWHQTAVQTKHTHISVQSMSVLYRKAADMNASVLICVLHTNTR